MMQLLLTTVVGPEYGGICYKHLVTSGRHVMCDRATQAVECKMRLHFQTSL